MSRVRSVFAVVLSGLAVPAIGQTTFPEANPLWLSGSRRARGVHTSQKRGDRGIHKRRHRGTVCRIRARRRRRIQHDDCQRAHEAEFARARNAEIEASVAAVAVVRTVEFEHARNAEIETVLAAYREAQFAQQRNAEIDTSISAVSVERGREYVRELNARADADRAAAREAEFALARNAEIDTAIAASQDAAFARARNAEAEQSIAAVNAQRVLLETGTITAPTPVERQLRQLAAALCWTLTLLSILLMGGGLVARRWRLRRAYLGAKLHLAHEAQSARRTLSRMTDQNRPADLREIARTLAILRTRMGSYAGPHDG